MRHICGLLVLSFALGGVLSGESFASANDQLSLAEWENRAVEAVVKGDATALRQLVIDFHALPTDVRRKMPLRIRDTEIELVFRGDVPAGGDNLSFMELLISGKERAYEALLVADESELQRVARLRPFFASVPRPGRHQLWRATLVWSENGRGRSVDVKDIVSLLPANERAEFLDGQEVDPEGNFGGEFTTGKNAKCDPAALPRNAVSAELLVTLRLNSRE